MAKLQLERIDEFRSRDEDFQPVFAYKVTGLPEGHRAHIQNLAHPGQLWSIQRFRGKEMHGDATGRYISAEGALAVLQEEYP